MWPLPLMRYDLDSSCWRTSEVTSLWALEMSSPTFPEWGMTRGGELFALPTPVRPTVAPESSSLLGTPTTMDSLPAREGESYEKARKSGGRKNRAATGNLREQVIHALPTPHAGLGERGRDGVYPNPRGQQDLQHAISSLLPTPKATNNENRQSLERYGPNLGMVISDLLPTPTCDDANNATRDSGAFQSLTRSVVTNLLPTPTAQDVRDGTHLRKAGADALARGVNHALGLNHLADNGLIGVPLLPTPIRADGIRPYSSERAKENFGAMTLHEALIGASTQPPSTDGSTSSAGPHQAPPPQEQTDGQGFLPYSWNG